MTLVLTVSELVRRITFGAQAHHRLGRATHPRLNRLGGLLKKLYLQSGGVNAAESARVLRRIYAAIDEQADRASIR